MTELCILNRTALPLIAQKLVFISLFFFCNYIPPTSFKNDHHPSSSNCTLAWDLFHLQDNIVLLMLWLLFGKRKRNALFISDGCMTGGKVPLLKYSPSREWHKCLVRSMTAFTFVLCFLRKSGKQNSQNAAEFRKLPGFLFKLSGSWRFICLRLKSA